MHLKGISLRCISFCIKLVSVECVCSVLDDRNEIYYPDNEVSNRNYAENSNNECRCCLRLYKTKNSVDYSEKVSKEEPKNKLNDPRKIVIELCV